MKNNNFIIKYLKFILPFFLSAPFIFILGVVGGDWVGYLLFLSGLYLGALFLYGDERWLYNFCADDKNTSQVFKQPILSQEQVFNDVQSAQVAKPQKLITRSTLFLLAMVPLTVFVLTSSGSLLGSGLVIGILLGVVEEMWRFWAMGSIFQTRFMHDLKTELSQKDIRYIVMGVTGFLVIMIILVGV